MVKNVRLTNQKVADPTPAEIQERAAAIRQGWSDRERLKRAIWSPPAWLPPVLAAYEFMDRFVPVDETV